MSLTFRYMAWTRMVVILVLICSSGSLSQHGKTDIRDLSNIDMLNSVRHDTILQHLLSPFMQSSRQDSHLQNLVQFDSGNSHLYRWIQQNWINGKWENNFRYVYSYNSLGRADNYIHQKWDTKWINQYRNLINWGANGKVDTMIGQSWNGIDWHTSMQNVFLYNPQDLVIERITQNKSIGGWVNLSRILTTYTSDSDVLINISQDWDGAYWVNSRKQEYEYIAKNLQSRYTISHWNTLGYWIYDYRESWTYVGTHPLEYLYESYDVDSSKWDNSSRIQYSYFGNTVTGVSQVWTNDGWETAGRVINIYIDPEFKYLSSLLHQGWYNDQWVDGSRNYYKYDDDMNQIELLGQSFNGIQWVNSGRLLCQYGVITHPEEGDVLIAGEKDTIKWTDNWKGKTLTLEYSTDDGTTYTTLAENVSGDSLKVLCDIPDSILSKKCYVKATDANSVAELSESDRFGIRPYILTRTDTTTDEWVMYNPLVDMWGFQNDSADMWPEWWYPNQNSFDYDAGGIDPYTGLAYPLFLADSAFLNSGYYEYPDWPSFVRAFSPSACYIDRVHGIYSLAAVRKWYAISDEWGGSCFGIAGTNAMAFMHKDEFQGKYPAFPQFQNPVSVASDSNVIMTSAEIFTHQFGKPSVTNDAASYHKTANQTLQDIKTMFRKSDEARSVTIFNQHGDGGHTILPYKLEKDRSQEGIYNLYVYDNSYPDLLDARIRFDTTGYGNMGTWEPVYGWANWGGNKGIYLEVPSDQYIGNAQLSKRSIGWQSEFMPPESRVEVLIRRGCDIVITNALNEQTGYTNGQIVKQVPDAYPMIVKNGSETPPYGYSLPNNRYSIEITKFTAPKTSLNIFAGNRIFTVSRDGATNAQMDDIRYGTDQRIVINNPSGEATKIFKFSEVINESVQEKMYIIRNLEMNAGDSIEISNTDTDKLKLTNDGSGKNYRIELQYVKGGTYERFQSGDINLVSLSSHTVVANWDSVSTDELIIFKDSGNDGTIDETLHVQNTLTGVPDHGSLMPNEFKLYQSYPNPFNPTTTIEYQLPLESKVSLKVYNLLGQNVAVLYDGIQTAGDQSATWDASAFSSGIYIYKLEAVSLADPSKAFTSIKKMLLVR